MIALLVITDGRTEHIQKTLASFDENIPDGVILERWMYDDSGDPAHRAWLEEIAPGFRHIHHAEGRQGFGGAIQAAWSVIEAESNASWIFHLEDDFTFNRPIPIAAMQAVLKARPSLAQMALRRQPWNDAERAAGGVVELNPAAYEEHYFPRFGSWLEQSLFWTTNPSLYPRSMLSIGWPHGLQSEGRWSAMLRDRGYRFGYWGSRDSGEWVHHIGTERNGKGY